MSSLLEKLKVEVALETIEHKKKMRSSKALGNHEIIPNALSQILCGTEAKFFKAVFRQNVTAATHYAEQDGLAKVVSQNIGRVNNHLLNFVAFLVA